MLPVRDVVGFRKLGHNETDEPSYTQPLMYARVKAHPGVRAIYAQKLIREGVIDEAELNEMIQERVRRYEDALARAKELVSHKEPTTAPPVPERGRCHCYSRSDRTARWAAGARC